MTSALEPEQEARVQIDAKLEAAGWAVQDRKAINLGASRGVAGVPDESGHGRVDLAELNEVLGG